MPLELSRELQNQIRDLSRGTREGKLVEIKLSGAQPPISEDEVLVLVLSGRGGLASRHHVRAPITSRSLRMHLDGAQAAVAALDDASSAAQPAALSASEASLLDEAGFREAHRGQLGALERSKIEYGLLARRSLSLEQASKRLRVTPSRLRQRLSGASRTLYGFKEGRTWRVPSFQITSKGRLVPGIDRVIPHIRSEAHPLSVVRWFTQPHLDLVVGDEEKPVTPLDWLSSGMPPEVVATLAEEI